jgi:ABC-type transporter Mla MlaB component
MLRITRHQQASKLRLQLEGDLTGAWVDDLLTAWRECRSTPDVRPVQIDLSAVGRIDKSGEYMLALVHSHGARLTGSGLATRHLIRSITRDWARTNPESKEA